MCAAVLPLMVVLLVAGSRPEKTSRAKLCGETQKNFAEENNVSGNI